YPCSRNPHFFLSSRRRHTRFSRDWSSDVCSSDLLGDRDNMVFQNTSVTRGTATVVVTETGMTTQMGRIASMLSAVKPSKSPLQRSEERRVGKERRSGW